MNNEEKIEITTKDGEKLLMDVCMLLPYDKYYYVVYTDKIKYYVGKFKEDINVDFTTDLSEEEIEFVNNAFNEVMENNNEEN